MLIVKHIKDQSGIALVIAMVMLLALTVIGIAALTTSTLDVQISGNERRAAEALNLADAGIEKGLLDALRDYDFIEGDSNWSNNSFYMISNGTAMILPLNAATGNFDCSPQPDCIDPQFGDPFGAADIGGSKGQADDIYGGARTLGDGKFRVLMLRDPGEPDELYIRSYAEHSTGARKIIQLSLALDKVDVWRNALFGGRGTAAATINGNINVAGPVHILGTGATNDMTISGASEVRNNYKELDAAIRNRLLELPIVGYHNGLPIRSLEAIFRVKNVQVGITGSGKIGLKGTANNTDLNGDEKDDLTLSSDGTFYWKAAIDAIYANKQIDVHDAYKSIHSDNVGADGQHPGYDLGDKIQLPTLQDNYAGQTDRIGDPLDPATECVDPSDCKYLDYITTKSVELDMSGKGCAFEPGVTTNFSVGASTCGDANDITSCSCDDPNGCLWWDSDGLDGSLNPIPNLIVDGRVEITGCGQITVAKNNGITYQGKGILYTAGEVKMDKDFLIPTGRKFVQDDLIAVMTKEHMRMAPSTQQTYMGAFYASGSIGTNFPGAIVGALVGNYFCMGTDVFLSDMPLGPGDEVGDCTKDAASGNAADVYYTPGISDELRTMGMLMGNIVYYFDTYDWEQIY